MTLLPRHFDTIAEQAAASERDRHIEDELQSIANPGRNEVDHFRSEDEWRASALEDEADREAGGDQ